MTFVAAPRSDGDRGFGEGSMPGIPGEVRGHGGGRNVIGGGQIRQVRILLNRLQTPDVAGAAQGR